jgi:hypothetical protein|nr:MAG TPA: hypothetical protein [Caudoviricetes sp.]
MKVSRLTIFELIVVADEKGDYDLKSKIMQIIAKCMKENKNNLLFTPYFEIKQRKDVHTIRNAMKKYNLDVEYKEKKQA